jgi:cytoskeletal protein RodZ
VQGQASPQFCVDFARQTAKVRARKLAIKQDENGVGMSQSEAEEAELPLESVGVRLLRAREASGMSRGQLAGLTRIPERHLAAIEAGDFAALPASTYAVGFSRTYAKALGLDDAAIGREVRAELTALAPEPQRRGVPTFEPGDPARVPSGRLAWLAAFGVVAVIIAGLLLWRSLYAPAGTLGSILPSATPAPVAPASAAPVPAGPVVFTALEQDIWVKFYDAAGSQLMQKQLAQGESWTVPADQPQVLIWTGRPEALAITIGGQPVPKLSEAQVTMKDVPVTAAALLARGQPAPVAASPAPATGVPVAAAAVPRQQTVRRNPSSITPGNQLAPVAPAQASPPAAGPAVEAAQAPTPVAT